MIERDAGMTLAPKMTVTRWREVRQDIVDDRDIEADLGVESPWAERSPIAEALPAVRRVGIAADEARAAVTAAYAEFQREIFSFSLHGARDEEVAEDVTQEAFLRLLREIAAGRSPDNVRAWLYRVAGNLLISRGRRQSVAQRWLGALARSEVTDVSPERVAVDRERHEDLEAALAKLPADARVGVLMAAQGFSGREIAESIGRSEQATRTMLCRARIQLRHLLDPSEDH
jgi:RNA polymerase sigma factor (sigma-70 family)